MAAIGTNLNAGIVVKMPFVLDVSGLAAELFGEAFELTGTPITVGNTLSVANFYDSATGAGWLHYLQAENEDSFDAYVNRDKSEACELDISGALKIEEGLTYDVNVARDNLDCSGAFPAETGGWTMYHSLEDFVISWFANKILGHPGALAAISNDSYLRAQAELAFQTGILAMEGAASCALSVSGLASLGSDDVTAGKIATGPANGMTAADLNLVVQQIMNLAPARFENNDRGYLYPVQWYAGDKIQIKLSMVGNSYKVAANAPAGTTVTTPDARASGGVFVNSANSGNISDEEFVLEFTMA